MTDFDRSALAELREAVLTFYARRRRDLPWRRETHPYRLWVSEVMLQQTRVETVVSYYEQWVRRFPDLATLADAPLDDVLRAWSGMGYYRRAHMLHAAAAIVRDVHGGELPSDAEELRRLPGVGEYTAAAVASIAYGRPLAAIDGNVRRVLARLHDEAAPSSSWLRDAAAVLLDQARPGEWNQALMELGATVCTPSRPSCSRCPLSSWCAARAAGTQEQRPAPGRRRAAQAVEVAVAVVMDRAGRALFVRRPPGGMLAGMWSFPETRLLRHEDPCSVLGRAVRPFGLPSPRGVEMLGLAPVRHRFTHRAVTYRPVLIVAAADGSEVEEGASVVERRWRRLDGWHDLAVPVAQRKIAALADSALRAREDRGASEREATRFTNRGPAASEVQTAPEAMGQFPQRDSSLVPEAIP